MKLDIFSLDNLWHFLAGAGITGIGWVAALTLPSPVIFVAFMHCVATVLGIGREVESHWDDVPMWNPHRITEAAMWFVGGLPVTIAAFNI